MDRLFLPSGYRRDWRIAMLAIAACGGIALLLLGLIDPARVIAWITDAPRALAALAISTVAALLMFSIAALLVLVATLRRNLRISSALDNMTQGLCMFDSSARLILCNEPYLDMYGLTRKQAYPGCPLRELLEIRKASGTFFQDIDEYRAENIWALGTVNGAGGGDVNSQRVCRARWFAADSRRPVVAFGDLSRSRWAVRSVRAYPGHC